MPSFIDAYMQTDMDGLHDALKFGVTTELERMGRWSAKQRKEISERNDVADLRSPGMGVTPREGHPTEYMSSSNNGSITLKIGLEKVDIFTAAAIRVKMATQVLTTVAFSRKPEERPKLNTYGTRNLLLVASAGLLTYDIGAIGYVTAMHLIGAGKTTLLSASAPIFLQPMSVLILKERLSPIALAGVCVAVAGICLVAI